jgi:hypothetical protein
MKSASICRWIYRRNGEERVGKQAKVTPSLRNHVATVSLFRLGRRRLLHISLFTQVIVVVDVCKDNGSLTGTESRTNLTPVSQSFLWLMGGIARARKVCSWELRHWCSEKIQSALLKRGVQGVANG